MAEANRDEALKCFEISKRFHAQKEYELAFKYAEKSVKLYSTESSMLWLETTRQNLETTPKRATTTGTTMPKDINYDSNDKTRSESRSKYSVEQVEEVNRFLKIDKNDFYAVLGIPQNADDNKIKKAYRKFHPDKNQAPGADEAFKIVSRAFSCLSDPQKRAQYDRFGAQDAAGMPSDNGSGIRYRRTPFGGASMFETEVSPEELFNMFFGDTMQGGGAGFQFGSNASPFGPMFVHSFNGGGFPFRRTRHRSAQPKPPVSWIAWALQLIPVIIMALIILFSNWGSTSINDSWESVSKYVSFNQTPAYSNQFVTQNLKIPYYATHDFKKYFADRRLSHGLQRELKSFEDTIERKFVIDLQQKCREEERDLQSRRSKAANNSANLEKLKNEKCASCERLHALGIKRAQ